MVEGPGDKLSGLRSRAGVTVVGGHVRRMAAGMCWPTSTTGYTTRWSPRDCRSRC